MGIEFYDLQEEVYNGKRMEQIIFFVTKDNAMKYVVLDTTDHGFRAKDWDEINEFLKGWKWKNH